MRDGAAKEFPSLAGPRTIYSNRGRHTHVLAVQIENNDYLIATFLDIYGKLEMSMLT